MEPKGEKETVTIAFELTPDQIYALLKESEGRELTGEEAETVLRMRAEELGIWRKLGQKIVSKIRSERIQQTVVVEVVSEVSIAQITREQSGPKE